MTIAAFGQMLVKNSSNADLMIVTETGRVGIGTTSPAAHLEIKSSQNKLKLSNDDLNSSEMSTDANGNFEINPASRTTYINSSHINKNAMPNTALIVHADNPWAFTSNSYTGTASIAYTAQGSATGIFAIGKTEYSGARALAVSAIAAGHVGTNISTAVQGMVLGNGSDIIRGGDFFISHSTPNQIREGTLLKLHASCAGPSGIDSLRGIDLSDWQEVDGTVTHSFGIFMDHTIDVGQTSSYAIYSSGSSLSYFNGNVGIGTSENPLEKFISGLSCASIL